MTSSPCIVAVYINGEGSPPVLRPAPDPLQGAIIAHALASDVLRPTVVLFVVRPDDRLVRVLMVRR